MWKTQIVILSTACIPIYACEVLTQGLFSMEIDVIIEGDGELHHWVMEIFFASV